MVKKIVNLVILLLFIVRLMTYSWPGDAAGLLNALSLVIIAAAAGIAAMSLWEDRKK